MTSPWIYNYIKHLTEAVSIIGESMLHIPCETWSRARHGTPGSGCPVALRDMNNLWGLPNLNARDQMKLEAGNASTRACLNFRDLFQKNGVPVGAENGDTSFLWALPEIANTEGNVLKGRYHKEPRLAVCRVRDEKVWAHVNTANASNLSCAPPLGPCVKEQGSPISSCMVGHWEGTKRREKSTQESLQALQEFSAAEKKLGSR